MLLLLKVLLVHILRCRLVLVGPFHGTLHLISAVLCQVRGVSSILVWAH